MHTHTPCALDASAEAALCVCLICLPYMSALYVCRMSTQAQEASDAAAQQVRKEPHMYADTQPVLAPNPPLSAHLEDKASLQTSPSKGISSTRLQYQTSLYHASSLSLQTLPLRTLGGCLGLVCLCASGLVALIPQLPACDNAAQRSASFIPHRRQGVCVREDWTLATTPPAVLQRELVQVCVTIRVLICKA